MGATTVVLTIHLPPGSHRPVLANVLRALAIQIDRSARGFGYDNGPGPMGPGEGGGFSDPDGARGTWAVQP